MEFKGIIKEMFKEKQSQIDMRICLSGSAFLCNGFRWLSL
ncbi:hypothetical protein ROSEINA2194_03001 [Roseburia inulinivorans DSM 16841]|uniref:Uncharacterized protein n=1 Tax=Roseburia inulinivorans DSM 16841 TaxID=622312 RepID=C0FW74_9FIRM|nr:hypothetical protein ROSEINA2194_03001 [Roseburia inulinivorans DSM 16841]